MFISIYFKTSSCDSDPEINTFIYGPPPSINSAPVSTARWTASDWTHVSRAPYLSLPLSLPFCSDCCLLCPCAVGGNWSLKCWIGCGSSSYSFLHLFCSPPLLFWHPPPGLHLLDRRLTGGYMAVIHDKQRAQPTAEKGSHIQNKCKWSWALSWASSSLSKLSGRLILRDLFPSSDHVKMEGRSSASLLAQKWSQNIPVTCCSGVPDVSVWRV